MKKSLQLATLLTALAAPLLALAQTGINTNILGQYSSGIIGVVNNILVPVLMAIAFIVFLWGVYRYFILGATNESEKAEGRWFAFWGIIGFIIIVSLWGLVNLLMGTFGLQAGVAAPPPPTFGTGGYAPAGNTGGGLTGPPGTSAYGTSAQNAALLQQYYNWQSICSQNSTSPDCQAARAAYSASYYSVNPNPSATEQNAQITTVGAGADCTYSPCSAGLTCGMSLGYPTCEAAGGSGGTSCPAGTTYDGSYDCVPDTVTSSDYQACVDANGGDPFGC